MKNTQLSFFSSLETAAGKGRGAQSTHGGWRTQGRRKGRRPLLERKWTHLVLKSTKATGLRSFLSPRNRVFIEKLLRAKALRWHVQIGDFANVGNHLHLKLRFNRRENFQGFLRSVTGLIARHVTGAKRGNPQGPFWQGLAFTRVLRSAFEALQLKGYFQANRIEARKGEKARQDFLTGFNLWIGRIRSAKDTS